MGGEPAEIEVRLLSERADANPDVERREGPDTHKKAPRTGRRQQLPDRRPSSRPRSPDSSARQKEVGAVEGDTMPASAISTESEIAETKRRASGRRPKRTRQTDSATLNQGATSLDDAVSESNQEEAPRTTESSSSANFPETADNLEEGGASPPPAHERDVEAEKVISELLDYLLGAMNVQADAYVLEELDEGSLVFEIEGEDSGLIIGHRGDTIRAFQLLVRMLLKEKLGRPSKFIIDVEDYRNRRLNKVKEVALSSAEKAVASNCSITLDPMPANERRMVHMSLAENDQVSTESKGQGRGRRVIIHPR